MLDYTGEQLIWAVAAGLVPTALAVPLLYKAIEAIGSPYVSIFSTFELVATLGTAALFLGEPATGLQVAGMGQGEVPEIELHHEWRAPEQGHIGVDGPDQGPGAVDPGGAGRDADEHTQARGRHNERDARPQAGVESGNDPPHGKSEKAVHYGSTWQEASAASSLSLAQKAWVRLPESRPRSTDGAPRSTMRPRSMAFLPARV